MTSVHLGRILLVVILSWAVLVVSGGASAAGQDDVQTMRQKAEQGYAPAQFKLCIMYFTGKGVKQDYAQARLWLQKAVEQGYAPAQSLLGRMYYNGQGVKQDYAQARLWLQKAAEQGYAGAQKALNAMQTNSEGDTGTFGKSAAAGDRIPPIPSRDGAWILMSSPDGGMTLESYVAPSTIVHYQKPKGFGIWNKVTLGEGEGAKSLLDNPLFAMAAVIGMGGILNDFGWHGSFYTYDQFDCSREATRMLAWGNLPAKISSKKLIESMTLWHSAKSKGEKDMLVNYCPKD